MSLDSDCHFLNFCLSNNHSNDLTAIITTQRDEGTALLKSAAEGQVSVVVVLLDNGVPIDFVDSVSCIAVDNADRAYRINCTL